MITWTCTGWQRGGGGGGIAITHHINCIAVNLNPMIFTNHGSPEEKSHITHYENSNHASCSLFRPDQTVMLIIWDGPSSNVTGNSLCHPPCASLRINWIMKKWLPFVSVFFFSFKTHHIYHKFVYMLNLHVSCKFCCVSGVLHL